MSDSKKISTGLTDLEVLESAKKYNFDIKDAYKNLDVKKIAILEPNINIIKTKAYTIS